MPTPVNQTTPLPVDGPPPVPAPSEPQGKPAPPPRSVTPFAFPRAPGAGWLDRLGRLLLPPRCLACGEPGADGLDLCAGCHADLPWARPACARCALPLPAAAPRCGRCAGARLPWAAARALCWYAPPLDRWLPRLKFHGDLAVGRVLASLAVSAWAGGPRPDALLALPLHRSRLRRRGFDQARELARPLAAGLGLPLLDGGLRRRRATAAQSTLDAAGRQANLRGAFAAEAGFDWPAHVALVDDVMTTGSTLAEAARALRRAGVARVEAWVFARALPPGGAAR